MPTRVATPRGAALPGRFGYSAGDTETLTRIRLPGSWRVRVVYVWPL